MLTRFFPTEDYETIFDIDYKSLSEKGYKGIMFDIDNTLVPFDVEHPSGEIIDLFEKLKELGFKICLVSNNTKERVNRFNEKLKVLAIPMALKPMVRNLRKAMKLMGTSVDNSVFIGDQLFTDMWAGNRLNVKTILVTPIAKKEQRITSIKRKTEKKIFQRYLNKKHHKNS